MPYSPINSGAIRLFVLPLLRDLDEVVIFSWDSAVLAYLYRELCRANGQLRRPRTTIIPRWEQYLLMGTTGHFVSIPKATNIVPRYLPYK